VLAEPGQAGSAGRQRDDTQAQRLPLERAPQDQGAFAELVGHVGRDPLVGGCGRGEHRHARRQAGEQVADPAVVGAEVVSPVTDAVRLVDHHEADGATEAG
jgi:hypothetical protein